MLLVNHKLTAQEAYEFNFVSKVFTASELDTILWPQIREMSKLPSNSIQVTKKLMTNFDRKDLQKSCDDEIEELYKRFESEDFITGIANFLQRKSKL